MRYGAKEPYLTTLGGRITCPRCQATSKRTKRQCKAPAVKGKQVCRFHGGYSTGPKTPESKARASGPHTTCGHETREFRDKRQQKMAVLDVLMDLAFESYRHKAE